MTSGSGERLRLSAVCETDCFPLLRASVQHEVKHSDPGDSVEVWAEGSPRCVPVDEFMGILPNAVSRHVSGAHFSYLPSALNSPCRAECLSEAEVGFLQSDTLQLHFLSTENLRLKFGCSFCDILYEPNICHCCHPSGCRFHYSTTVNSDSSLSLLLL